MAESGVLASRSHLPPIGSQRKSLFSSFFLGGLNPSSNPSSNPLNSSSSHPQPSATSSFMNVAKDFKFQYKEATENASSTSATLLRRSWSSKFLGRLAATPTASLRRKESPLKTPIYHRLYGKSGVSKRLEKSFLSTKVFDPHGKMKYQRLLEQLSVIGAPQRNLNDTLFDKSIHAPEATDLDRSLSRSTYSSKEHSVSSQSPSKLTMSLYSASDLDASTSTVKSSAKDKSILGQTSMCILRGLNQSSLGHELNDLESWHHEFMQKYNLKKRFGQIEREKENLRQQLYRQKARNELTRLESLRESLGDLSVDEVVLRSTVSDEFPDITEEMEDTINKSLRSRQVITECMRLEITAADLSTLCGLTWLNDQVINFYMNLIMDRAEKSKSLPKVYCFHSFFYTRLCSAGYSGVRRWTKKVDLFSHEMVILPVHLSVHWCLAVIDLKEKKIDYYDSMGGTNEGCLRQLRDYIVGEYKDKKGGAFDLTGWQYGAVRGIPHQMNGSDCGVFACQYAQIVSKRRKIDFDQSHMPYFRQKMQFEIVSCKLIT